MADPQIPRPAWRPRFFQRRDGLVAAHAWHEGWHHRGYLPHLDRTGMRQGITFRLADAVPAELITRWHQQLGLLAPHHATPRWTPQDAAKWDELRRKIAKYEDAGHGECLLADPALAGFVAKEIRRFAEEKYTLLAWCVMPNHAHVLVQMKAGHALGDAVRGWKGSAARKINQSLGREGQPLWFPDYHDRFIRNADHLRRAVAYIENNPVAAGLVKDASAWRWSSLADRKQADRELWLAIVRPGKTLREKTNGHPSANERDRLPTHPPASVAS